MPQTNVPDVGLTMARVGSVLSTVMLKAAVVVILPASSLAVATMDQEPSERVSVSTVTS